jgi:hypothetical protein
MKKTIKRKCETRSGYFREYKSVDIFRNDVGLGRYSDRTLVGN